MCHSCQAVGDAWPCRYKMSVQLGLYTWMRQARDPPEDCWYHTPTVNFFPTQTVLAD